MKPFAMMRDFTAVDLEILDFVRRFDGDGCRKVSFFGLFEFRRGRLRWDEWFVLNFKITKLSLVAGFLPSC
jgi:hypothetical protein